MAEWQSITLVRYSEKQEPRNIRRLHIILNPAPAVVNIQCTPQAAAPRQPMLHPMSDQSPITQQPLAPGAILRCHPLGRMHRKSTPVPPPLHYPNRLAAKQPAPLKQPQHPLPHCRLHPLHTCFIHPRPAKHQLLPPLRHHPVQYAQMQMHVCVQRRAKAVHKQHPPRCGLPPPCLCSLPQSRAALRSSQSSPPGSSSLHQELLSICRQF